MIAAFYSLADLDLREILLQQVAGFLTRRGRRVLVVDLALGDRPGSAGAHRQGLFDSLLGGDASESEWQDLVVRWRLEGGGAVDLVDSGLAPDGFDVHESDAASALRFAEQGGVELVERLRAAWRSAYDVVLVDSFGGGVAAGTATIQLADVMVPVVLPESADSLDRVIDTIQANRRSFERDRPPVTVLPVVFDSAIHRSRGTSIHGLMWTFPSRGLWRPLRFQRRRWPESWPGPREPFPVNRTVVRSTRVSQAWLTSSACCWLTDFGASRRRSQRPKRGPSRCANTIATAYRNITRGGGGVRVTSMTLIIGDQRYEIANLRLLHTRPGRAGMARRFALFGWLLQAVGAAAAIIRLTYLNGNPIVIYTLVGVEALLAAVLIARSDRLWPSTMELWAFYRGQLTMLYRNADQYEFGKVRRAVERAMQEHLK